MLWERNRKDWSPLAGNKTESNSTDRALTSEEAPDPLMHRKGQWSENSMSLFPDRTPVGNSFPRVTISSMALRTGASGAC